MYLWLKEEAAWLYLPGFCMLRAYHNDRAAGFKQPLNACCHLAVRLTESSKPGSGSHGGTSRPKARDGTFACSAWSPNDAVCHSLDHLPSIFVGLQFLV